MGSLANRTFTCKPLVRIADKKYGCLCLVCSHLLCTQGGAKPCHLFLPKVENTGECRPKAVVPAAEYGDCSFAAKAAPQIVPVDRLEATTGGEGLTARLKALALAYARVARPPGRAAHRARRASAARFEPGSNPQTPLSILKNPHKAGLLTWLGERD